MGALRWLGQAATVTDLWTISAPSGTIVSQTYSVTINGKSVTYSAGGSDSASVILGALQAALASITSPPPPEFQELTWGLVGTVGSYTAITATQNAPGVPSIITVATGGAATFTIANTTAATGPNFWSNTQNWSTGAVPVNSDNPIFDSGSVPCTFGINTSLTGIVLNVNPGYTGMIGLPLINSNGASVYNEYRTTSLTLAGGATVINAPSCSRINLAFGAHTTTIRVQATGSRLSTYIPPLLITGGNGSSEIDLVQGDCALAYYTGTTANFPVVKSGYLTSPKTDVNLLCGAGCTLGAVTQNGGNVTVSANVTTCTMDIAGGTLTLTDSVTATTINASAGVVCLNTTGAVGTLNLYGSSTMTADQDPRAKTITNPINAYSNQVAIIDNQRSINSGVLSIALNGIANCAWQHGISSTLVVT